MTIPELEFEIPSATQKGTITTAEGLLSDAASGLRDTQVLSPANHCKGHCESGFLKEQRRICVLEGHIILTDEARHNYQPGKAKVFTFR